MSITVYAKPHCPQCAATQRQFNKLGVEYQVIDLTQNQEALDSFIAQGFQQAPVVVAGDEKWSGFRPDMIKKVAALVSQAA